MTELMDLADKQNKKRQKESQSFDHVATARKEEGQISQDEEERQ